MFVIVILLHLLIDKSRGDSVSEWNMKNYRDSFIKIFDEVKDTYYSAEEILSKLSQRIQTNCYSR